MKTVLSVPTYTLLTTNVLHTAHLEENPDYYSKVFLLICHSHCF